jgi:hypothetical protein
MGITFLRAVLDVQLHLSCHLPLLLEMQSYDTVLLTQNCTITNAAGGNFAQSALTINGWLRDFLWAQASNVIQSYGSALSAYGLRLLGRLTLSGLSA